MSATFTVNGDVVTITFVWENIPLVKAGNLVEYAALDVFERDPSVVQPTPFDQLTNQQKLDIVYNAVRDVVVRSARSKFVSEASETAAATAEQDIGMS